MLTWYGVSHSQPFKSLVGETFTFIEHPPEPSLEPLSQCLAQAQDQGPGVDLVVIWTPILQDYIVLVGIVEARHHTYSLGSFRKNVRR